MRIKLCFETKKSELPIEYRKAIMSFFKNAMQQASPTLYEMYYSNCKKKKFTFSTYIPHIHYKEQMISFQNNQFFVHFSTNDTKAYFLFANMFQNMLNVEYPLKNNNTMTLVKITPYANDPIQQDTIVCKTLSPICLQEHHQCDNKLDYYYSIQHSNFSQEFLKRIGVEFININCKTTIVKHQGLQFETTSGTFALKGDIDILQNLFDNGIGNRCGQGFGMIQLLK